MPALPGYMGNDVDEVREQQSNQIPWGKPGSPEKPEHAARPEKRPLDRAARQQKLRRLKMGVAIAGLAGTGLFAGLAAANTHAATSHTVTPDQQITTLENAQGGSFFSSGGDGVAPPSASGGPPQTSSGGS